MENQSGRKLKLRFNSVWPTKVVFSALHGGLISGSPRRSRRGLTAFAGLLASIVGKGKVQPSRHHYHRWSRSDVTDVRSSYAGEATSNTQLLPSTLPSTRARTIFVPNATRNAGNAVMTGQIPSERSRRCRCWVDPARSEWMFAPTASPNAPSATARATCSAAEPDEFCNRKRSYAM